MIENPFSLSNLIKISTKDMLPVINDWNEMIRIIAILFSMKKEFCYE